jgi:hypothetical protein
MSRLSVRLASGWNRLLRAYHLAMAREDMQLQHLQVPVGLWSCDHCRLVLWDQAAYDAHKPLHTA